MKCMLSAALRIGSLPGRATLRALSSIATPSSINALSTSIAQASIQASGEETSIETNGLEVTINYDQDALLTTGGFSTAMALGTVYWIGSKLNMQFRYSAMIKALESLKSALAIGDNVAADEALRLVDNLSNPLIDPVTLQPLEASDEVKAIYESLFDKPAKPGAMFNASTFTSTIDDAVKLSSRTGLAIAIGQTDEALEAMIKKARPIAGKAVGRLVGAVLWVDTVWWLATSALDVGLNFLGVDEEDQKIPILSDIPVIGSLFDLSDSTGSSFVDIVLSPIFDGIFSLFDVEDEVQVLTDSLWSIITSAALSPTLLPFTIALLEFYIESIDIEISIPATFTIGNLEAEFSFDVFGIRPEPIDVLVAWLYLVTGKIIFKAWVKPAFDALAGSFKQ